jgi:hypothetical protein
VHGNEHELNFDNFIQLGGVQNIMLAYLDMEDNEAIDAENQNDDNENNDVENFMDFHNANDLVPPEVAHLQMGFFTHISS